MTRDKYEVLKLGIFKNYFIASPRLLLLVGCILEGFNFLVYALLKYFNASDSHSVLAGAVAFFVGFPLLNFPPSAFVSYGENTGTRQKTSRGIYCSLKSSIEHTRHINKFSFNFFYNCVIVFLCLSFIRFEKMGIVASVAHVSVY